MGKLKQAQEWAYKNLLGKQVYCPILKSKVNFNLKGINHALRYNVNDFKIALIYRIESYLKRADKMIVERDKKYKKRNVYKLSLNVQIEKRKYDLYITIKENPNGKFYYDSGMLVNKK